MMTRMHRLRWPAITVLAMLAAAGTAGAQTSASGERPADVRSGTGGSSANRHAAAASKHVEDAVAVVHQLETEPRMRAALREAKGVFIVPAYGRVALGVGASGGTGVLLVKREDNTWSDPAFYNLGSLNVGAQAGAEGGAIAMVLNNDKAVNAFMQKNNFTLSADAGLTIVNWSKVAHGAVGVGDIIAWSGARGLFGDVLTIGVRDIRFNENLTDAYYHMAMSAKDAVSGVRRNPQADPLRNALAAATIAAPTSGASGKEMESGGAGSGKK